ncbi:MAG: GAF domain-containing protein [Actinobacteria bacterium]|nr:GAF domain-containing protein [Actinomycetota bacterium]
MNWFREIFGVFRTRLGRKAAVPVLLIVLIFLVPFFFAFRSERIADATSAELASRNEISKHLSDMEGALRTEQISVYEMVYEHETEDLANFEAAAAAVQFYHDEATEHVASAEEQALLDECQSLHERAEYITSSQIAPAVLSAVDPLDHTEMVSLENELQGMYGRMTELGGQLEAMFAQDMGNARLKQIEAREFASELTWASIIFAVFAGFLIKAAYTRQLVYPIKRMSEASLQIARGDLSQRVEVKGQDELADMGRAFNDMADSLERRTEQLEREKARIRSIHQSIGDGILVIDRAGVIISVNPAAERILERPVTQLERTTNTGVPVLQEALAQRIGPEQMVECWEEKDCAKVDCPSHGSKDRRCWLQCGTFCYNQIQGTFKQKRDACERCDVFVKNAVINLTLDIGDRHYSTSILPILDDLGQEEGRTVVMHDITEVLQAKESVERHSAELAAINSISEVVSESLDLQTTLDNALEKIKEIRDADAVSIHLITAESDGLYLAAEKGLPEDLRQVMERIPLGFGCPGVAVDTGGPVYVGDLTKHRDVPVAALEAGFLSSMAVPLKSKNKMIGSLSLAAGRLNAFTREDIKLLSLIGMQVGVAVDNSILYEESVRHSQEALAKSRIVSTLTSTLELEKVFDDFSEAIRELVDFDRFSVIIGDGDGPITKLLLPSGVGPAVPDETGAGFSMTGTAAEWTIKNNRPYLSGDISAEKKYQEQEHFVHEGYRSQLNLPLVVKGTVLGSMNMVSTNVEAYDEKTIGKLQPVADQVALTIANQKLFEDVAHSKAEWETTFDSASEGIAMVGTNHRILRLNKAAAEMMGGTVGDFVGRSCFEVIHDSSTRPAACLMNEAVAGSSSARGEQEMDDGRTIELVVDPVYDNEGSPAGAVHFLRDITEAKRLRQQLLQSEKMIAVGQLVAGVAHEINNPLTGVIGYAQLLLKRDIDDQAKKDAEGIYREADRATRIVRHLLSFARKHQPERKTVDINAVVRESVELKAYEMRVNNIATEAVLDDRLPMTVADPHQLQQVFVNLINNAEQAMLDHRGSGLLKISTALVDNKIRVSFVDNGPGISEEIAERIFDPFFTTKDVGKGTGLGLSVCYGVAQDHGGRIWIESVNGQGAEVIVELPVVAASPVKIERDSKSIKRRLGKILLVDDEAAIRQVLTQTLRQAGHEVETAGNGVVALRMLKKKHYDCVVSDVKMPVMDGPSLHKAAVEMDPDIADSFIFISGDTISPDTRSYLNQVENPRLAKPFDLVDLETALQKLLAAREVKND